MIGKKSICRLTFGIIILGNFLPSQAGDAVPVVLWGGEELDSNSELSAPNPLLKTSRAQFDEILSNKLRGTQPPVLVFVKDSLCAEDFNLHKEGLRRLTTGRSLTYLPAVDSPLSVFENLSFYNQTMEEDVDSIPSGMIYIKSITDLDNIADIYNVAKGSNPNLMTVLMGRQCMYSRLERAKRETKSTLVPFIVKVENGERQTLFYSSEPPYLKTAKNKEYVQITNPIQNLTRVKEQSLILRTTFNAPEIALPKVALEFQFDTITPGYYTLKTIHYRENDTGDLWLTTNTEIVFPYNFSYHCSRNIVFNNGSVSLRFTDLQVQLDAISFSDAYDCIGFTTIPIWTGIFVTAILALIMIWGLTMIIDIRTMDRFDDPKGKTITISAQE